MYEVRKDEGYDPDPGKFGVLVSRHRTRSSAERRVRLEAEKYAREFYSSDWEKHVEAYADLFDIEQAT